MARRTDPERVEQISEYIARHPGSKPADIAQGLELSRSTVARELPSLEEHGHLLFEDRQGRLWPFRK